MQKTFKKTLVSAVAATLIAGAAHADVKIGLIMGFTGPLESLAPPIADSAEIAFAEASNSGNFLGGEKIVSVRGDGTCVDAAAGTAVATRLVNSDGVAAIFGAMCSGTTAAIAKNVGVPNGVAMISPSATSPTLADMDDNGIFYRTAATDARQGVVLAEIVKGRGIDNIGITYTNNDYGKGIADAFAAAYKGLGGTVVIEVSHEEGKADYTAEVATLSASGAEELAVLGYADGGGREIMQTAIDTGAFDRFILADGMIGEGLLSIDGGIEGSFGTKPGSLSEGAQLFKTVAADNGVDGGSVYADTGYDAGAILALAIQAAGSTDRADIVANIANVANAPGEVILPGQLAKGLEILANGGQVNYEGASAVEFDANGDNNGSYLEQEVNSGQFETVKEH